MDFLWCLFLVVAVTLSQSALLCESHIYTRVSQQLTAVPDDIPEGATEVNLAHNNIYRIGKNNFANLHRCKELQLDDNQIYAIEVGAFTGLGQLRKLILSRNKLYHLKKDMFIGLSSLRILDLSYNQIQYIDYGSFDGIRKPVEVWLHGNNLLCGDSLCWLYRRLKRKGSHEDFLTWGPEPLCYDEDEKKKVKLSKYHCAPSEGLDADWRWSVYIIGGCAGVIVCFILCLACCHYCGRQCEQFWCGGLECCIDIITCSYCKSCYRNHLRSYRAETPSKRTTETRSIEQTEETELSLSPIEDTSSGQPVQKDQLTPEDSLYRWWS